MLFLSLGRWITSADKSFFMVQPEVLILESLSDGFKVLNTAVNDEGVKVYYMQEV
jgi:hypothetical protein